MRDRGHLFHNRSGKNKIVIRNLMIGTNQSLPIKSIVKSKTLHSPTKQHTATLRPPSNHGKQHNQTSQTSHLLNHLQTWNDQLVLRIITDWLHKERIRGCGPSWCICLLLSYFQLVSQHSRTLRFPTYVSYTYSKCVSHHGSFQNRSLPPPPPHLCPCVVSPCRPKNSPETCLGHPHLSTRP